MKRRNGRCGWWVDLEESVVFEKCRDDGIIDDDMIIGSEKHATDNKIPFKTEFGAKQVLSEWIEKSRW